MDYGLRRSTRVRKNAVLDFPDSMSTKKRTLLKCETDEKEQQHSEEQQQQLRQQEDDHLFTPRRAKSEGNQQLQPQEGERQQEDRHLVTPGHVVEAEVAGIGGVESIPIEICSSPEETKHEADHLSLLQPVSKPNYHVKVPQESLKKFMDAAAEIAAEIKSALVSHLEKLAHSLDIVHMIKSANECFERMRTLEVDYEAFHGEISRLIESYQKLKEATEGKNLELEAAYAMCVIDADDAKKELHRAENDLLSAQNNNNLRRKRIKELNEILGTLEAEDAMEGNRLATLTAERDRCHEAHSCSKRKVDRLYSELGRIIKRYDATREEIQRSLSRLRGLV